MDIKRSYSRFHGHNLHSTVTFFSVLSPICFFFCPIISFIFVVIKEGNFFHCVRARPDDAKIMRSRDVQCNSEE